MPDLEWTEESTFSDATRNFLAVGPGVYDVPEGAVEEYLDHRTGGWCEPDPKDEDRDEDDSGPNQDGEDVDAEPEGGYRDGDEDGIGTALDASVEKIEHALASGEFDDVLDVLERAERDGKNRSTALEAIDERRNDIEPNADG